MVSVGVSPLPETAPYSLELRGANPIILDWGPMITGILDDISRGIPMGVTAGKFHCALVEAIVSVAQRIGEKAVVLTGGCFQNVFLTEHTIRRLRHEGFSPYWHRQVPPNDGGIALGQSAAVMRGYDLERNSPGEVSIDEIGMPTPATENEGSNAPNPCSALQPNLAT